MTNSPLFSVLIANYNNGQYLQEAIDSVLAQSYPNWEIILVDDGSTDNSREIYSTLKDNPRIHIYYNDKNEGCGYTKRRCAELANGELCGFLDADDILLQDALEHHVNAHTQHPEASCIFSQFYYCDAYLNVTSELRQLVIPQGESYFTHRDYLPEHLASFKRISYQQTTGIDPTLPAAVDQDLYFKLEEVAPIRVIDRFTYKYRQSTNQLSQGERQWQTYYWNLLVRQRTCERRGLSNEKYLMQDLAGVLFSLTDNLKKTQEELSQVRSSYAYRIGKALLRPFRWLRHK